MTVPLAPDCRLEPTPDLRTLDGGRILIGGAPLRILRLGAAGAEAVRGWFAGQPVAERPAHHELARRLESNGMAHLRWPKASNGSGTVGHRPTVIIPSHDDRHALMQTLGSGVEDWAMEIIVVDDGSSSPIELDRPMTSVIRRPDRAGPGPARQTGLEATDADIVVFIDAGVTLDRDAAATLLAAFDDPAVVAAAPRVVSEPGRDLVARYDLHRSPLDLGPSESLVGLGRLVTYVPTACLAVRTEAVRAVGGFDPRLRYGEDVDLVWRLGRIGNVRYLPRASATHRPRASLRAMLRQRRSYGSAAAGLAKRHGSEAVAPCKVSPWSALVFCLMVARRPLLAVVTAAGTGLALRPKLEPMPDARAEAMALTLRGHWYGGLSILTAVTRSWFPLLVPLLVVGGRPRRTATAVILAATARRGLDGPRRPASAALDLSLGLADDLAYCAGLWQGSLVERSTGSLRPALTAWPGEAPRLRERLVSLRARARSIRR